MGDIYVMVDVCSCYIVYSLVMSVCEDIIEVYYGEIWRELEVY